MTTFLPSMAEAQAIGVCWLARHDGLPDIAILRAAMGNFHPLACGWCSYPPAALMEILRAFRPVRSEEDRWWALPARAKGEAIRAAQGHDDA
jgi:hypothetical protein